MDGLCGWEKMKTVCMKQRKKNTQMNQRLNEFIWLSEYLSQIKKTSLTDLSCDNCGSWFSSETKVAL